MLHSTTAPLKYENMAEALFIGYRGQPLRENNDGLDSLTLSEAIVVNGNHFIPANSTLIIDLPAERN